MNVLYQPELFHWLLIVSRFEVGYIDCLLDNFNHIVFLKTVSWTAVGFLYAFMIGWKTDENVYSWWFCVQYVICFYYVSGNFVERQGNNKSLFSWVRHLFIFVFTSYNQCCVQWNECTSECKGLCALVNIYIKGAIFKDIEISTKLSSIIS